MNLDKNKKQLEIYKQRYETFRHLDKLFWQMLQISIGAVSIVLAFGKGKSGSLEWWTFGGVAVILLLLSFSMLKIDSGKRANGKILNKIGKAIGDGDIPEQSSKWCSASFWTAIIVGILGIVCLTLIFLI